MSSVIFSFLLHSGCKNNSQFFPTLAAAKVGKNCELFLQPEWSRKEKMTELIVEYVMKNPKWKISLQTHKYLNIP